MQKSEIEPVLYILGRTDLESMNPGKLAAQASHASNAFRHEWGHESVWNAGLYKMWHTQTTQGFGTVLVLGVNEEQMQTAVKVAHALNFACGIVHDPTYPVRDGECAHFIPLDTCGYVFGNKNDPMLKSLLGHFELYP